MTSTGLRHTHKHTQANNRSPATVILATAAHAQFNPGDFNPGATIPITDLPGAVPTGVPTGGVPPGYPRGFDTATAARQRRIHGILASLTFIGLFPLGALSLRLLPGRWAFWTHAILQVAGWVVFVAAAALGFVMVRSVRVPMSDGEGWLIYDPRTKFHPIVGIVVFILVVGQPLLGWLHHRKYQIEGHRTAVSYLHIWNGRALMVMGIVNGGLGLRISGASDMVSFFGCVLGPPLYFLCSTLCTPPVLIDLQTCFSHLLNKLQVMLAYTIIASILASAWVIVALLSELRRMRGRDVFGRLKRGELRVPWRRSRGHGVRMVRIDKAVRTGSADGPDAPGTGPGPRYA